MILSDPVIERSAGAARVWPTVDGKAAQCGEEARQCADGIDGVSVLVCNHSAAIEPAVDRPVPRIAGERFTDSDWSGIASGR